jgi:hypothetical protein
MLTDKTIGWLPQPWVDQLQKYLATISGVMP